MREELRELRGQVDALQHESEGSARRASATSTSISTSGCSRSSAVPAAASRSPLRQPPRVRRRRGARAWGACARWAATAPADRTESAGTTGPVTRRRSSCSGRAAIDQAEAAFTQFLADFPTANWRDNAQYWLAETHYVNREFETALRGFQLVIENFPEFPQGARRAAEGRILRVRTAALGRCPRVPGSRRGAVSGFHGRKACQPAAREDARGAPLACMATAVRDAVPAAQPASYHRDLPFAPGRSGQRRLAHGVRAPDGLSACAAATATLPTHSTAASGARSTAILAEVRTHGARHVCVTGGEPLAQRGLCRAGRAALRRRLPGVGRDQRRARHLGAGSAGRRRVMDVKTPGSGEVGTQPAGQPAHLRPQDYAKFVICDRGRLRVGAGLRRRASAWRRAARCCSRPAGSGSSAGRAGRMDPRRPAAGALPAAVAQGAVGR
jgi:hypothetical protein